MVRQSLLLAFLVLVGALPGRAADKKIDGQALYQRQCAGCHGPTGEGDGPDALIFATRPRNLREGFLAQYPTEDLVKRIRGGVPLQLALDNAALQRRATEVESIVAHMRRLPTVRWPKVENGWETYARRCEVCHGVYGAPVRDLPPGVSTPRDLSAPDFQASVSDEALRQAVRHGHHHMPALVPRITEAEANDLASFVRLLSPGFELYTRYCASCHGDEGRGVGSLGEVMQLPTVVFDKRYFARRNPEDIRKGVWHMVGEHKPSMPHFRWTLSEAQARAIVEYLKSTEPRSQ